MIHDCAHLDMEYVEEKDGIIEYQCKECGEILEQFQDCVGGR